MKKTYCKPQISFEDFELSANIASHCHKTAGPSDIKHCAYDIPGIGKLFLLGYTACNYQVRTDGQFGLCYHIPFDTGCLFNS